MCSTICWSAIFAEPIRMVFRSEEKKEKKMQSINKVTKHQLIIAIWSGNWMVERERKKKQIPKQQTF